MAQLPEEMLKFILEAGTHAVPGPRLGQLVACGRNSISTPHYAPPSSRGVIPHLSPDLLERHTQISAVYVGLEDFTEKSTQNAPILESPTSGAQTPLTSFTALSQRCLSILGPRRVPRIRCRSQNTDNSVAISTSVGFRTLTLEDYLDATERLKADVVVTLADIADADKVSLKRMEKMADRTHAWLRDTIEKQESRATPSGILASVLPLNQEQQQLYLSDLAAEYKNELSGVCLYDPPSAQIVPTQLSHLPRFCISDPANPHELLRAVSHGVDLITTPFVTAITEQGVAFVFEFPAPPGDEQQQSMGMDLWSSSNATVVEPLRMGCKCYTCTRHHRAYLHHLLQAKEMLAWTLLQIHNFHVMDQFFLGIRASIQRGTFDAEVATFRNHYEEDFGVGQGKDKGPRMRGYQMKSIGRGQDPKREKIWGRFGDSNDTSGMESPSAAGVEDDQARKVLEAVESGAAADQETEQVSLSADELERMGLAERVDGSSKESSS